MTDTGPGEEEEEEGKGPGMAACSPLHSPSQGDTTTHPGAEPSFDARPVTQPPPSRRRWGAQQASLQLRKVQAAAHCGEPGGRAGRGGEGTRMLLRRFAKLVMPTRMGFPAAGGAPASRTSLPQPSPDGLPFPWVRRLSPASFPGTLQMERRVRGRALCRGHSSSGAAVWADLGLHLLLWRREQLLQSAAGTTILSPLRVPGRFEDAGSASRVLNPSRCKKNPASQSALGLALSPASSLSGGNSLSPAEGAPCCAT